MGVSTSENLGVGRMPRRIRPGASQKRQQQGVLLVHSDETFRELVTQCIDSKRKTQVLTARNLKNARAQFALNKGRISLVIAEAAILAEGDYELLKSALTEDPDCRCLITGRDLEAKIKSAFAFAGDRVDLLSAPFSTTSLLVRIWDQLRLVEA